MVDKDKRLYVLFGAGEYGKKAIRYLSKENIAFFIDNDEEKQHKEIYGIPVYSLDEVCDEITKYRLVLSVSEINEHGIIQQLENKGIKEFVRLEEEYLMLVKQRVNESRSNIEIYKRAIEWIENNTIDENAMCYVAGGKDKYPEVTGYFIPTLLNWGYREKAASYAKWLCNVQMSNGSWGELKREKSFLFDTGQVIKGLLAIRRILPSVKENIIKACDWIISHVEKDGRLPLLDENDWGKNVIKGELIHLYCLSPLVEAGHAYDKPEYIDAANDVLTYYKNELKTEILSFDRLSHFQAYILEGLVDIGESELAEEGMNVMSEYMEKYGYVPAYKDVTWVCSTGLFQLAIVWYKLGNLRMGDRAFSFACSLQNESGGWYGSYPMDISVNNYFPHDEISWAVKFFLDALHERIYAEFKEIYDDENALSSFHTIQKDNELYCVLYELVKNINLTCRKPMVLDVGCGYGRYLNQLAIDFDNLQLCGTELLEKPLKSIENSRIKKDLGTLTSIPAEDATMDLTYTCEALEHAIDVKSAIREMARVTKSGGYIVVIDKNIKAQGNKKILKWEQYFDEDELKNVMEDYCSHVTIKSDITLSANDSLKFSAWIGKRK